jgi:hypothetical protein
VNSICDKIGSAISELEADGKLLEILSDMKCAIQGVVKVQGVIVSEKLENLNKKLDAGIVANTTMLAVAGGGSGSTSGAGSDTGMVCLGNIAKRPRQLFNSTSDPAASSVPDRARAQGTVTNTNTSPELDRFKEAVREAENSTLLFNLDMGRVPIMNRDTIKLKATLAMTSMAAKLESENRTSVPCEDTVAAIDDILSVATGMEFFGRKTKTYTNKNDPNSGLFCTIPVKYTFPDKDTRVEAETILKEKCGINCATPYPVILRECIKQVIDKVKEDYPNSRVKVIVDANRFCLRAARREKGGEGGKKWESFESLIPLPREALNVETRRVPEGFSMEFLPPGKDKGMGGSPVKVNQQSAETAAADEAAME